MIIIDQVQGHCNDKSVAISIRAAKVTARILAQAMQAFLKKARNTAEKHGKQSVKSLTKSGASIDNTAIPGDMDIGSFKKTARKYNIDFALKKDVSTDLPNWIVFFKSKDAKSMDAAFKEFSSKVLTAKTAKPSIEKEMERFKEKAKELELPVPAKGKVRGDIEL